MTRSMVDPLSETGFHIYMHAFRKCFGDQAKAVMGEDAERELDEQEQVVYKHFKAWIYRKQKEHLKFEAKSSARGESRDKNVIEAQATLM